MCGVADLARPFDAHTRRELADHLISQPQAEFDARQARTYRAFGDVLCSEIELGHRLEDQPPGDALIVGGLDPAEQRPARERSPTGAPLSRKK
jgi:hypothetical protein